MELEINQMLRASGLTEESQKRQEELVLNKISPEEMQERRAQLAQMRSLMFFQEQKQKKIAKIKSKAYRKIQNKAHKFAELKTMDPEAAHVAQDKADFDRAKERMTLKHKNTGKWAKQMLGRHNETGSQREISQQLQKHADLTRKIKGPDSESESQDEKEGLEALVELDAELEDAPEAKGIFAMKFMKRAAEKAKKDTKAELISAQRSLAGLSDSEPEEVKPKGRREYTLQPTSGVEHGDFEVENDVVKTSGVLSIGQDPLFPVVSFEEDDKTLIADANQTKIPNRKIVKPAHNEINQLPNAKSKKQKTEVKVPILESSEEEETKDVDNPWITDSTTAVKKTISGYKPHERTAKQEKALSKLASKIIANRKTPFEEVAVELECLSAPAVKTMRPAVIDSDSGGDSDYEALNATKMIHEKNLKGLNKNDIMSMAFANDDVMAVIYI